jgi:hypothetical protein
MVYFLIVHDLGHFIPDDNTMLYLYCSLRQNEFAFCRGFWWYSCVYRANKRISYSQHQHCIKTFCQLGASLLHVTRADIWTFSARNMSSFRTISRHRKMFVHVDGMKLRLLTAAIKRLIIHHSRRYISMESHGGMILTGENRRTRRKTCPSATLTN